MLIYEYEKYPMLYTVKHPQYYNKHRRNLCLQSIVAALAPIRPNTNEGDEHKKLRTQLKEERHICGAKPSTVAPDTDAAYATYVHARLAKIKNERRKQRVKHAMDALLFTALEEEADEVEQSK
ncbi:hypothetical protein CBL_08598 [Carabus blaptoides fortunei]